MKSRFLADVCILFLAVCTSSCSWADEVTDVPENRVTFYTTYGAQQDDNWIIPLRIWVHEEPDLARELLAKVVRDELVDRAGMPELDQVQKDRFMYRADGFIADSESRETISFSFDDDPEKRQYQLRNADGDSDTDRNGLIEGTVTFSNETAQDLLAAQHSDNGWLTFRAVSDDHGGVGRVRLIGTEGVSVISDVDDTTKVTNIPSGEAEVLKNTFFREFTAAPCMADLYQSYGDDVSFHYVSGGPWQMYGPLAEFLFGEEAGFPEGTFHMKNVRTNPFESESYEDIWKLIGSGSQQVTLEQKIGQISALLQDFPRRNFVLIGDSGEKDPEVFAAIREQFPDQVAEIQIRDVVNHAKAKPERLRGMTIIPAGVGNEVSCSDLMD
jgi:hypothetical protein